MNDVMVRSDYEKVFNEKGVFEESFMLKTFANFAGNANGLAVTLTGAAADAKLEFSVRKPGAETFEAADFERDGKVVLLTPDVKETMGATYRITAKYDAPVAEAQAGTIKPFIYRTDRDGLTAGKRWEVHIPYEAPTARAEMSFFGTNDDKSIPEKGIYAPRIIRSRSSFRVRTTGTWPNCSTRQMKSPRSIRSTPLMRNGPLRTAKRIKTGTRNNTPLFRQIRPAAVTAGRIFFVIART